MLSVFSPWLSFSLSLLSLFLSSELGQSPLINPPVLSVNRTAKMNQRFVFDGRVPWLHLGAVFVKQNGTRTTSVFDSGLRVPTLNQSTSAHAACGHWVVFPRNSFFGPLF
jgi:hypothetical protein